MSETSSHRVSLGELDAFIADMASFDARAEAKIAELEAQMARLHGVWVGQAAAAQKEAHAELTEGLADMRAALAALRTVARTAHGNYSAAILANERMFKQVG